MKTAVRLLGGLTAAGAGFLTYQYNTNEGIRRNVTLWKDLGPVIMHYRMVEAKQKLFPPQSKEEAEMEWQALHNRYAQHVLETILFLRGFYIKVGQVAAHRNDLLPDIYIDKLRTLEDAVPPLLSGEELKAKVCKELGINTLDEIFESFEESPLGSASIGQVHRARLKKERTDVAVKIQSPGVEKLFRTDLKAARSFFAIFAPEQVVLLDEIERAFLTEFDYRAEAQNLRIIYQNMQPFKSSIKVPYPYEQYSSREVLTMEYLKGPKLIDGIRQMWKEWAEKQGTTVAELERTMKATIEKEGLPPPYRGPSAFELSLYRGALRWKDSLFNAVPYISNGIIFTINALFGTKLAYLNYSKSFVPLNSAFIMDTLLKVHGHQMLVNGMYQGDPHPGNFLLLEDGRIGLLDFGQAKKFGEEERILLAKTILALVNEDKDTIRELSIANGYTSKYLDKEVMYKMSVIGLDRDGKDVTEGLNIQQFLDKMFSKDPWTKAVDSLVTEVPIDDEELEVPKGNDWNATIAYTLSSLRKIDPEEEITISYIDFLESLDLAEDRCRHLQEHYMFWCSCRMCSEPLREGFRCDYVETNAVKPKARGCPGELNPRTGICGGCGRVLDAKELQRLTSRGDKLVLRARRLIHDASTLEEQKMLEIQEDMLKLSVRDKTEASKVSFIAPKSVPASEQVSVKSVAFTDFEEKLDESRNGPDENGKWAKDRLTLKDVEELIDHVLDEDDVDNDGMISWEEYLESQKSHNQF
ncbi:hypothetical protein HDU96_000535 [Phlyctochytrium bullatum]|nr:hypothetical protein HDU96_000535 [Phlyctochytrium bullatum]